MNWINGAIVIIPLLFVLGIAFYCRRYVKSIVDFLAAGRVAGRYVISVGDMAAGLSVISLVSFVEVHYQTGFAVGFWWMIIAPISLVLSLSGYCIYRYRQTRALSMGQFLEIRYNRSFRLFASAIRITAEMIVNALSPAIAARFFIYFFDFPFQIDLPFIGTVQTYVFVVILCIVLALFIIWPAGRISLLVTDTLQGLLSYPIFVVISIVILCKFSWFNEITPVLHDRVPGESFLNPFDVSQLRDFNLMIVIVALFNTVLNRAAWIGNDTSGSGRTPHEQKMASILGSWRAGFSSLMMLLVSVSIIAFMAHADFADDAKEVRSTLASKVAAEVVVDPAERLELQQKIEQIPVQRHQIGVDTPLSQKQNLESVYLQTVQKQLAGTGQGNYVFQKFRVLYSQMMFPIAIQKIFPPVVIGLFALLMVMLLVSTDDSRIFNAAATLVQDIVLPLHKGHLDEKKHLFYLRLASLLVGLFFFLVSVYCTQLDYIQMFFTIVASLWLGGSGAVMVFGLYSRFGNTTGAFCSIFFGSGFTLAGIVLQRTWALHVYPFLDAHGWSGTVGTLLETLSLPLNPYVVWTMDPIKFPINSYEIFVISMILSIVGYVGGSLLTYRKPFNLDKMLHRGAYRDSGEEEKTEKLTIQSIFRKILGITPEYTRGDRIIAWAVFLNSFVWGLCICFIGVVLWNQFSPWPDSWWGIKFFITSLLTSIIIGVVSTIWFTIGGIVDTRRLFIDLEKRVRNPEDNGQVNEK